MVVGGISSYGLTDIILLEWTLLLQNPPNSPDLAYPIGNLWAYIKPRIKKRDPQNIEELKKFTFDELNNIPKKIIEKCGKDYIKKLEKVIEISGERLEPFHLRQIRNENGAEDEENKEEEDNISYNEEENENIMKDEEKTKYKMKIIYNDKK